jgi:hypothetical protein
MPFQDDRGLALKLLEWKGRVSVADGRCPGREAFEVAPNYQTLRIGDVSCYRKGGGL